MILTAHQPLFLPWLGFWHKLALAERFCLFDTVRFDPRDYGNRNRILTDQGPLLLTVPVVHGGSRLCLNVLIDGKAWAAKHRKAIRMAYARAPFADQYLPGLDQILGREHKFLADLDLELLQFLMQALGLERPVVRASDLHVDDALEMCLALKADKLIFGQAATAYADFRPFWQAGVATAVQDYRHPNYRQMVPGFVSGLSVIDLLFNAGPSSRDVILHGNVKCFEAMRNGICIQ